MGVVKEEQTLGCWSTKAGLNRRDGAFTCPSAHQFFEELSITQFKRKTVRFVSIWNNSLYAANCSCYISVHGYPGDKGKVRPEEHQHSQAAGWSQIEARLIKGHRPSSHPALSPPNLLICSPACSSRGANPTLSARPSVPILRCLPVRM